jgi:hypothetical protein
MIYINHDCFLIETCGNVSISKCSTNLRLTFLLPWCVTEVKLGEEPNSSIWGASHLGWQINYTMQDFRFSHCYSWRHTMLRSLYFAAWLECKDTVFPEHGSYLLIGVTVTSQKNGISAVLLWELHISKNTVNSGNCYIFFWRWNIFLDNTVTWVLFCIPFQFLVNIYSLQIQYPSARENCCTNKQTKTDIQTDKRCFVFWKEDEKIIVHGLHNNKKLPQNLFFLTWFHLKLKVLFHIIVPRYMLKVFYVLHVVIFWLL